MTSNGVVEAPVLLNSFLEEDITEAEKLEVLEKELIGWRTNKYLQGIRAKVYSTLGTPEQLKAVEKDTLVAKANIETCLAEYRRVSGNAIPDHLDSNNIPDANKLEALRSEINNWKKSRYTFRNRHRAFSGIDSKEQLAMIEKELVGIETALDICITEFRSISEGPVTDD